MNQTDGHAWPFRREISDAYTTDNSISDAILHLHGTGARRRLRTSRSRHYKDFAEAIARGAAFVEIRPFQRGDEFEQLRIYNTAASSLPRFKPATVVEIQRRTSARDFDPNTRLYAVEQGEVVGYCTWQPNGRVGFPWCLPGHDAAAEPLFAYALQAMKSHGVARAFSAYRKDWQDIADFFQKHGFAHVRDMINFIMPAETMPTPFGRAPTSIAPVREDEMADILALGAGVIRVRTASELKATLWNSPWFKRECVFVMRDQGVPIAAGVFVTNPAYADARMVDSEMPCFRLGAFGTEGLTTKRIKGLFSFVTSSSQNVKTIGLELLAYAAEMLTEEDDIPCYAAQVGSDAPSLSAFYEQTFQRQGSFPVFEREI